MRKHIKEKRKGPHLDRKLRERRAEGRRFQRMGERNIRKAAADSKGTNLLGMDGITYGGPNRRRHNLGQMQYRWGHRIKEKANTEQAKRDARRDRRSLNIRQRQKRKKRR